MQAVLEDAGSAANQKVRVSLLRALYQLRWDPHYVHSARTLRTFSQDVQTIQYKKHVMYLMRSPY